MAVTDAPGYVYTREERAAYALSGVFKVLSWVCAAASIVLGFLLAAEFAGFLVLAGVGLFAAAVLLFLSHVLILLAGIHARLGVLGPPQGS